jgi:ribosomal protein S18 acetylase RimI-like enzyme
MVVIRPAHADDEPFLWDMAWEAMAVEPAMLALGRDAVLAIPQVRLYLDGWGRPGDTGLIAVAEDGRRLGAAWYRLYPAENPSSGFVAADIPELSIGVVPEARGRGIGGALLDALLALAREQGYQAVSLSVDRENPARRLYERKGFHDAGVSDPTVTWLTMIAYL